MINADEIAGILKQQIAEFKSESPRGRGRNRHRRSARTSRASTVSRRYSSSELVEFPNGLQGIALNLEEDNVGVMIMGPDVEIKEGGQVRRTGRIVSVPVGDALLGRVVDPLGQPDRRQGPDRDQALSNDREYRADASSSASPSSSRCKPGIRAIDALIPIGKRAARADHRRPLDRQDRDRGRHDHQSEGQDVFCIYVAIGQKNSTDRGARADARAERRAWSTRRSSRSSPAEAAALKWLAPFAGCAMAEDLMYAGKDVLIVYDDLTKHAQAYREISLLAAASAGPRSLPGRHFLSALAPARARRRNSPTRRAAARMTALPVIETQAGDVLGLHSDQPDLDHRRSDLPDDGLVLPRHPARPSTSASPCQRVGGAAQIKAMRRSRGS